MQYKRFLLLVLTTLSLQLSSFAQGQTSSKFERQPLSAAQMYGILSGRTIKGEYRFMRARTQTFNFTETHNLDGTTQYGEGPLATQGRWYKLGMRKICYTYPQSDELGAAPSCFFIFISMGCYYAYNWRSLGGNGDLRRPEDWVARWVIEGDGESCAEPIS